MRWSRNKQRPLLITEQGEGEGIGRVPVGPAHTPQRVRLTRGAEADRSA